MVEVTDSEVHVYIEGEKHEGYYLVPPRSGRTALWAIGWYDEVGRQRRTRSARSKDVSQAWANLKKYAKDNPLNVTPQIGPEEARRELNIARDEVRPLVEALEKRAKAGAGATGIPVRAHDMLVSHAMAAYELARPDLSNKNRVPNALVDVIEVWGTEVTCRQLTGPLQHNFVANRRALVDPDTGLRTMCDWTILTKMNAIFSAMNHCRKVAGIVAEDAVPHKVAAKLWRPRAYLPPRQLANFGVAEAARMVAASFQAEHWLRSTLINMLAPRPGAGSEVQPDSLDLESETIDLALILPDGVVLEDNGVKRRATLKLPPTLVKWFRYWNSRPKSQADHPQYATYRGRRITSFKYIHEIARRAGIKLSRNMGAYLWRHFIASYLINHGCPIEQVEVLLGHRVAKGATRHYAHLSPEFLARCTELLEQMLHEIDALLPEGMSILIPHAAVIPTSIDKEAGTATVELENQPEPLRYMDDFWRRFSVQAGRFTRGTPVRRGSVVALHEGVSHGNNGLQVDGGTLTRSPE